MYRTRFAFAMIEVLRPYVTIGVTGNADVARILSEHFDMNIEAADVARWRRQHKAFDTVIMNSMDNLLATSASVIADAIRAGSVAEAKWLLERRHPDFKPSAKLEHAGRVAGLDEMLKRRTSDEDLYADGVLYDEEDGED